MILALLADKDADVYIKRESKLNTASFNYAADFSKKTGLDRDPPFPQAMQLGALCLYLAELDKCAPASAYSIALRATVDEYLIGLWWFIKLEFDPLFKFPWPEKVSNRRLKSESAKSFGVWLKALYNLAEKAAPYATDAALTANAAYWFHMCIKNIAAAGGIQTALCATYPLTPASEIETEFYNPSGRQRRTQSNKVRVEACELMRELAEPSLAGYFGLLMAAATKGAQSSSIFRNGVWSDFIEATNTYVKGQGGKGYQAIWVESAPDGTQKAMKKVGAGGKAKPLKTKRKVKTPKRRGFGGTK